MSNVSPDFRPAFSRYPFVYLCLYFSTGILCAEKIPELKDYFFLVLANLIIESVILQSANYLQVAAKQIMLFSLCAFFGFLAHCEQQQNTGWEDWQFHKGKTIFQMKVTEIQVGKPWTKGIGEIHWKKGRKTFYTPIRFYVKVTKTPKLDEVLTVKSEVIPIENKGNPGEFDLKTYWKTKGICGMFIMESQDFQVLKTVPCSYLTKSIREAQQLCLGILSKHLTGQELGIAQALILGDKSLLDNEIRNAFTATGSMHVLAVSGLHIGLILQLLLALIKLGARWINRSTALLFVILLLWFYALMTGFSPSVIRAVFMFSVLTWTQWKGWQTSSINSLFFTAFIIVLWKPMYFFDIGFQLSYLAMLGIFLFYPKIANIWKPENKILYYLWEGTAIGFAAQVATTPLTLFYFHQFPNYFAIANLGLMGLSSIVLGAGIFILVTHKIPLIGKLNGLILLYSVYWLFRLIQWIEAWPGALVYGFELELILAPILLFNASILFLGEVQKNYWKVNALHFLFILAWISHQRFLNASNTHLCLLNENKLTVILKMGERSWCFYDDENPDKIQFSAINHQKLYPSKLEMISMRKKHVQFSFNKGKLEILKTEFGREIKLNNQIWRVYYKKDFSTRNDAASVFMPWISHPHSLKNGAKIYEIAQN
ncbi:MAG: ComEC/Rec2 family competence protein [Crocinitomicaceae bacterium]|nr:ComEC/Rec2 family competence protein [Crocinitomicaceae bacterium]